MAKPVFPGYEDVDFEVEKEVWNVYELEDRGRVTIKMRTILIKLLKSTRVPTEPPPPGIPPSARKEEFHGSFQNIVVVAKCPPHLMGEPSPPPTSKEEFETLPRTEINFIPFYEDWNVYKLPDNKRLRVKLVVSSIFKVEGRYDQYGYPVYEVQSTNAIVPVSPKTRPKRR